MGVEDADELQGEGALAGSALPVAVLLAMLSSVAGLIISYHANLPSGPSVILAAGFIYLLSLAIGMVKPRLALPAPSS